jgi:hypothetical protein
LELEKVDLRFEKQLGSFEVKLLELGWVSKVDLPLKLPANIQIFNKQPTEASNLLTIPQTSLEASKEFYQTFQTLSIPLQTCAATSNTIFSRIPLNLSNFIRKIKLRTTNV